MASQDQNVSADAMKTLLLSVGSQVKNLRKERGLTLAALSETTGLSPAIVSQIERGLANPSFSTLVQIAHGLDIPVGRFFATNEVPPSPVVRKHERQNFTRVSREAVGDAVYEQLTPDLNGALEAHWVVSPPGHDTSATPFRHIGEELGIILSGKQDVYLDGVRYTVEAGDSIRYSSELPHWYVNAYDEDCVSIWVSTPPSW
ncbi:cupin domain-containing protein [Cnuibacter physcomitrellae]|uniref:helix-turn-helix domain-containing protein n=1 Tax=Cnuibacter physcomitrellae TaxID=1619308 RepID=UPI0021758013|nr:cupin domain-containing protein [Cnuibacter physcomitrellae]MCS5497883.1 cupin domain-containing protein [Cnuibacter physcomitrellae]